MATANGSDPSPTSDGAAIPDRDNIIDGGNVESILGSDGDGSPDSPRDPVASVKRGRGRPRKDGGAGTGTGTGSERAAGRNESQPKKSTKLDIELFATQIVGFHLILRNLTKNPLLEISQKEAETLAQGIKDVMMFHSINIAPSTLAYVKLIGILIAIYAPRFAMYMAATKAERDAKRNTFNTDGTPVA